MFDSLGILDWLLLKTVSIYIQIMKEKDLNKFYQENELDRLKGILFPKKNKKTPEGSTVET